MGIGADCIKPTCGCAVPVFTMNSFSPVSLHTYLADLNEQATERCSLIIEQMAEAEGVDETLKASDQMLWVQSMNSIRSRAEEIIKRELIYG